MRLLIRHLFPLNTQICAYMKIQTQHICVYIFHVDMYIHTVYMSVCTHTQITHKNI